MEQLHTKPFKMMEWKDCDFMFDMKNGGSDWDFNREIQLVFLHPPSSAVTLDEEQRLSPEDSINSAPSFLQWHRAARRWNSWTNRDLFLPEWGEKHQSISIFIFSHSFYFPSVCILYTWLRLCLLMWYIYIYIPIPALSDPTHDAKGPSLARTTCFAFMRHLKTALVCIFHTFGCIFSNHKITMYTCIVRLYCNCIDIARGVI